MNSGLALKAIELAIKVTDLAKVVWPGVKQSLAVPADVQALKRLLKFTGAAAHERHILSLFRRLNCTYVSKDVADLEDPRFFADVFYHNHLKSLALRGVLTYQAGEYISCSPEVLEWLIRNQNNCNWE